MPGLGVHALERLQQGNRRRVAGTCDALMQGEAYRDDKLPKRERETEERERRQDNIQHHVWFLKGAPPDCKRLLHGAGVLNLCDVIFMLVVWNGVW